MNILDTELRMSVEINEKIFQEIGKKLNTDPAQLSEVANFTDLINYTIALKIEQEYNKHNNPVAWELVVCIANQLQNYMTIEDKKLLEILYMNNAFNPKIPMKITLKVTASTPLLKEEFKQVVINSLITNITKTCPMNEINKSILTKILNDLIQ